MATKGVFTEKLEDIDDLMPPPISRSAPEVPQPSAVPDEYDDTEEDHAASATPTESGGGETSGVITPPRRRRAATSVPTAEVAPQIHRLLRRLTTKEKSRDPITARTYAQVVLDAIEAHQDQLAAHWRREGAVPAGDGLFSRRPAAPARRRRHPEPPARVPLTGLNAADAHVLDDLVIRWDAPSRSALVEQALKLYLNVD
ncbi:hypothetical protein [Mycobacterium kyorinense]|uniref:Uncharacterized protein n=1 Tax=Mycobacterium kyorinense TaxID=487514 RepID=A0A1X1Y7U6_9MYCO|nr:hypothetical protein [Mycobacterium kyorinense]ORW07193.1 hypothetical protein AWC14_24960 [Mycobacterium kyorinense]